MDKRLCHFIGGPLDQHLIAVSDCKQTYRHVVLTPKKAEAHTYYRSRQARNLFFRDPHAAFSIDNRPQT